jgi:hypothetical protein
VQTKYTAFGVLFITLSACSSSSSDGDASGGTTSQNGGSTAAGGSPNTTTNDTGGTTQGTDGLLLYGSPYVGVNMWYGPVDFSESSYHNGCGQSNGAKYPTVIQNLYGSYLIGLDGENIPNVESHCDNCAMLSANNKTIVARIITYGQENGVNALDLSPEARTALGLSDSNWTGTWQFSSCPTGDSPIYYEFDGRQWSDQNFWYMRIWTRNQHLPVTSLETKLESGDWTLASQQSDGAWQTVDGVDYSKGFQIRVTANDKQQLTDAIPAPGGLNPANPVAGKTNFR